jgi:hypothetical protein
MLLDPSRRQTFQNVLKNQKSAIPKENADDTNKICKCITTYFMVDHQRIDDDNILNEQLVDNRRLFPPFREVLSRQGFLLLGRFDCCDESEENTSVSRGVTTEQE